ncbi:enoyl-CoA hydratase family protein [Streptomyces sp. I05A-00742]|uniref:enoyl-CoA hydratase family protein n=1 Tax=Streptomyces sp. I05A-00742 TaxID=2732853 RepID=UPI001488B954|nr:enoyl-CoA hydratase family protein [Streptomyces sp. I05A-00742]
MPVRLDADAGVTTLTLDFPARRNALSATLIDHLRAGLGRAADDAGTRAVVLAHTGSTFCAGADLAEPPGAAELVALLREITELPKPVVARIDGHVRAGGLGIVGACDLAVAGEGATFAFTEVRLGLAPAVISLPLLPRLEPRAAARYCLTGETFDAREAARVGLVTVAAPDAGEALAGVLDGLRAASPQGLAETKRLLTADVRAAFDRDADALVALSERLFASPEAREGIAAFLERRRPAWRS